MLIIGNANNKLLARAQDIHTLDKNLPLDQIDAFYDFLFQKLEN